MPLGFSVLAAFALGGASLADFFERPRGHDGDDPSGSEVGTSGTAILAKKKLLSKLPAKPAQSLLVWFADKTHNAEAILFDYRVLGEPLWQRFNGSAEGTRWYYSALADVYSQTMAGRLSDRLSRAVAAFSV